MKRLKRTLKKYKSYIVLAIILFILIAVAYEYYNKYMYIFRDPNKIKNWIMSYGKYGVVVFLFVQFLQVVAFFIPGEIVQIAGGYIYGTLFGSIISILGITFGSIAAYSISRIYGKPLINKIISDKDLKFFHRILNLGSINFIVFLLYLIPGIPKDVLAYICGISNIRFKHFILYSTLGRLPGVIISAYFGSKIYTGNKMVLILIGIIMTLLFIIGVLKGEKIIVKITKNRTSESDKQL
ncbi:TVP38/TMEM64 family protein [Clostridium autoethanogenum]|uniref:TVP38/TMEM64 family membrane protein n=1 Tax=Clostridium autoethanogenum DSM 10061 TaxID=1341692 RepID=A0ABN4BGG0_9CLOT|nr:TVP38/TMEM64 family protein [Clostridium autoethanogenum]AGY75797.1 TVP38/TMEM64 family protein [Clostridium autoethanogenum DSM 10061]ALU35962.1 SNARE associated protein [Clostridium autoethanogenum DSM 10061]OVY51980.1 TVP38/TMEM64 family inner membrane protein YdjZ [Clostridium autoethanogenum]